MEWLARATTYNGYQLTATILASDVQALGNNSVTVYNAPPGGGLSAPLTFTVYLALATNDLVYNPVTQLLWASTPSTRWAVTRQQCGFHRSRNRRAWHSHLGGKRAHQAGDLQRWNVLCGLDSMEREQSAR